MAVPAGRMSRTPRNIEDPQLTKLLVDREAFRGDPLFVVDVGASGGIDSYWRLFGDQLQAVGFDPLTAEVERLNAGEDRQARYVAAWVTSHAQGRSDDGPSTQFFHRTSAVRASEIADLDFVREHFNAGAPIELTSETVVLDDYFDAGTRQRIDFLKVDTDGADYEVLRGAETILRTGGVLGVAVETQFQGGLDPGANIFSNIDSYLRGHGFSLFELEVYRYSRSALPAPFLYDIPAQTTTGQVSWGEAIYLRDLGAEQYESTWGFEPSPTDICKLLCLFEIFGLPDCSAELLLKYGNRVADEKERTEYLDVLAAEQSGKTTTYAELEQDFSDDARRRFAPRMT
jgi:FkbM family methyltransferase